MVVQKIKKILSKRGVIFANIFGEKNCESAVVFLARVIGVNLLFCAYHQKGIMNYGAYEVTGEEYFIKTVLRKLLQDLKSPPLFFDVGSNLGSYSFLLRNHYSDAEIYAFEPNKRIYSLAFDPMKKNKVNFYSTGFSNRKGELSAYVPLNQESHELGSVYPPDESEKELKGECSLVQFELNTLDDFCIDHKISRIDFLKIDAEGHELEILNGAQALVEQNLLPIIQFEFNELNITSRVFLRDFFKKLKSYTFYRIHPKGLIKIPIYCPHEEIFLYQNIIAINNTCYSPSLLASYLI